MNNFFLVITLTLVISCNVIFKIWYLKKDAKLIFQIYLAGRHVFFLSLKKELRHSKIFSRICKFNGREQYSSAANLLRSCDVGHGYETCICFGTHKVSVPRDGLNCEIAL